MSTSDTPHPSRVARLASSPTLPFPAADIETQMREVIAAKTGNQELALFYEPTDGMWRLELGNPSSHVSLGESGGEIVTRGQTISEALAHMKRELRRPGNRPMSQDEAHQELDSLDRQAQAIMEQIGNAHSAEVADMLRADLAVLGRRRSEIERLA